MEVYAILSWLAAVNSELRPLATCCCGASYGMTVAGRLAEAPPTAYLNQTSPAEPAY